MLKAALTHPKMYDLCARLGCSRREAVGVLELLWDFAGDFAPQGNLGKHSDGAIARACDWPGDPGLFVLALTQSGWLDSDPTHRLLIHDWEDHCHAWVRSKLNRLQLPFLKVPGAQLDLSRFSSPLQSLLKSTSVATREATSSQAKPSQAKHESGDQSPRARDLAAEALADACQLDLTCLTPAERGRFNKALKGLKSVQATPQQITERAAAYRSRFADCALTPTGLEANWGKCDPRPPKPKGDEAKAAETAELVRRSVAAATARRTG